MDAGTRNSASVIEGGRNNREGDEESSSGGAVVDDARRRNAAESCRLASSTAGGIINSAVSPLCTTSSRAMRPKHTSPMPSTSKLGDDNDVAVADADVDGLAADDDAK